MKNEIPAEFRFPVSSEHAELFKQFETVRIYHGKTKEEAVIELFRAEVTRYPEVLADRWVSWSDLETLMKSEGYTVARSTFWNYRKKSDKFQNWIRDDGINTIYNADKILAFLKGEL